MSGEPTKSVALAAFAPVAAGTPTREKAAAKPKAVKKPEAEAVKKASGKPTSSAMVVEAITKLGENGGSSLKAIKKSIADSHKGVDVESQITHIKKALKKLTDAGKLTQTKGKGASGRFKLAFKQKQVKKPATEKKSPAMKATGPKPNKAAAKKAASINAQATPYRKIGKASPKLNAHKSQKKAATHNLTP